VSKDATATTYNVQCGNTETCGYDIPFTVIQGPSTFSYDVRVPDEGTLTAECTVGTSYSATCTQSNGRPAANSPSVEMTTIARSDIPYMPVVVTAGAAAGNGSATTTTTSTASISPPVSVSSGTATKTSNASLSQQATPTDSASPTSSTTAARSNGAAPRTVSRSAVSGIIMAAIMIAGSQIVKAI
jgi:hypothetical protein